MKFILLFFIAIVFSFELNLYVLPHVSKYWTSDPTTLWRNWKLIIQTDQYAINTNSVNFVVPTFYLDETISIEGTQQSYYDMMKQYNLIFLHPSSNPEEIESFFTPYLSTDAAAPKRGLGLMFQRTASGRCFGNANETVLNKLKEMDTKFRTYANYLGMDVMDASVLQQFDIQHSFLEQSFPQIRTIHFNNFDTFESAVLEDAISLAKKFNTSLSIDISDIETENFVSCASFKELLKKIEEQGLTYKFLVNRSYWVENYGNFLIFFANAQNCLADLK